MKTFTLFFFFVVFLSGFARAQEKYPVSNDSLTAIFSKLAESSSDDEREKVNLKLKKFALEYASSDSVFKFTYDARYLGQITSPDSLVKMITWNLLLESGKNRFFCYLIKKGKESKNNVYELNGEFSDNPVVSDTTYDASNWYGALYYDIRPCPDGKNTSWVVLGLSYGNSDISRKIIDVISFENQGPVFGRKIFRHSEIMKYRQVFEYSSLGSMTLRFSSDSTIVFDHLVPVSGSQETGKLYYGSDFSYDSYVFSEGKWIFRLNVDARNKE